jgi:hypothetical protein
MPPVSLGTITNNTPPISPSPAALALCIANSTTKETGYESRGCLHLAKTGPLYSHNVT